MDVTVELKRKKCHVTCMQGFWERKKNSVLCLELLCQIQRAPHHNIFGTANCLQWEKCTYSALMKHHVVVEILKNCVLTQSRITYFSSSIMKELKYHWPKFCTLIYINMYYNIQYLGTIKWKV